jgi:hypothetical protein
MYNPKVTQPTRAVWLFYVMAADRGRWAEVGRRALAQNGVVTRKQLCSAGLTPAEIRCQVAGGRLHRLHQGIYSVGDPALLPRVAQAAAVLAVSPENAVLSHRSAAHAWGLLGSSAPAIHDVTLVNGSVRPRRGVRIHRVKFLDPLDVTQRENLPVTAPARTLIDFATDASLAELGRALTEARVQRLITDAKLERALARVSANHPGAKRIRSLLSRPGGRVVTRSKLERSFLTLVDAAGLPRPVVNVRLHGHEADFFWAEHNLVVEVDGYASHGTQPAFERDRRRDQDYAAAGIQVIRVTDAQLDLEPVALAVRIARALAVRSVEAA